MSSTADGSVMFRTESKSFPRSSPNRRAASPYVFPEAPSFPRLVVRRSTFGVASRPRLDSFASTVATAAIPATTTVAFAAVPSVANAARSPASPPPAAVDAVVRVVIRVASVCTPPATPAMPAPASLISLNAAYTCIRLPISSGGTLATSLANAFTSVSIPGPACAAPSSRFDTAFAMLVMSSFTAGPCSRAYSMKLVSGPCALPSDSTRMKWIALSVALFRLLFANSFTLFDSESNAAVLTPPPATFISRSNCVAVAPTIGVSFGMIAPSTANECSTGTIVNFAVESENCLNLPPSTEYAAAARCVACGIPANTCAACCCAATACCEPAPNFVTASVYFFCASAALFMLPICGPTAAPNAATASPAAPACTAIGASAAATGTAAGASDSIDAFRSAKPPLLFLASSPTRATERRTAVIPGPVASLTRTVITTSSAIVRLPSVVCAAKLLDLHEAHQLGVLLQQGGQGVAREPLQQAEQVPGAGQLARLSDSASIGTDSTRDGPPEGELSGKGSASCTPVSVWIHALLSAATRSWSRLFAPSRVVGTGRSCSSSRFHEMRWSANRWTDLAALSSPSPPSRPVISSHSA